MQRQMNCYLFGLRQEDVVEILPVWIKTIANIVLMLTEWIETGSDTDTDTVQILSV